MAIKRRLRPRRKVPPKASPWVRKCNKLYNRLQQPLDYDTLSGFAALTSTKAAHSVDNLALQLLERTDGQITTLQVNNPDYVSYRACLTYTDYSKKPKHGHLYPSKSVVKTSPHMWQAVILAYIELCKHIGRFV